MNAQTKLESTGKTDFPPEVFAHIDQFMKQQLQMIEREVVKKTEELKHFAEVQTELTGLRLFMSLNIEEKEAKNVSDAIRINRDSLWQELLKRNERDKQKASDFFYR